MGVTTTTTAVQSTSKTASDARMTWGATSSTDETARTVRGGGHAPSTSRAKLADPDKAGKEVLISTFSAALWDCTTITTNSQKRQYNFNIFMFFFQSLKCKFLGREREGLVEELLASKHSVKHYNTRVDNFKHGILHYKMIQSMSRLMVCRSLHPSPKSTCKEEM